MALSLQEIFALRDELGISTQRYQSHAESIYRAFNELMSLHSSEACSEKEAPFHNAISFRVNKNPPSLQVIKQPKKNLLPTKKINQSSIQILTTDELRREVILLTPSDMTLVQLHFHNLMPNTVWELSQNIKEKHPDTWLLLQRFTFENSKTTLPFPFSPVKISDDTTWEYLENLPLSLIG